MIARGNTHENIRPTCIRPKYTQIYTLYTILHTYRTLCHTHGIMDYDQ